jgi:hypothetical protein
MSRRAKGSVSGTGDMVGDDENKACACTSKRGRPASPVPRAIRQAEAAPTGAGFRAMPPK